MNAFARLAALAGLALCSVAAAQTAVGPAFTYQGRLEQNGAKVTGTVQVRITPWNAATLGSILGATQQSSVTATDGLFTIEYDPSLAVFETNVQTWLEIEVRASAADPWTVLPRQKLTAAPFSSATRGLYITGAGTAARVGIGAPTPANTKLLINEPTNAPLIAALDSQTTVALDFRRGGNSRWTLLRDQNDRFILNNNGTQAMMLRDNANWAFGPGFPANPRGWSRVLNIQAAANADSAILFSTTTNNDYWYIGRTGDGKLTFLGGSPSGNGATVSVPILEIRGGSDIAEPYDVAATDGVAPTAGMVVSIDTDRIGKLRIASVAYDRTVAGVISGANGVNTGLTLTQAGTVADGELPIAKVGRVWVLADADAAEITAGDLLTTASTPGHAMKAADFTKSQGAILGKAMSGLKSGKGYVLVLVGLQ